MEFLIVFGGILLLIGLAVRPHIQWEVDPNACNLENDKKVVRTNRRAFYGCVFGGSILILIGIIGTLFF